MSKMQNNDTAKKREWIEPDIKMVGFVDEHELYIVVPVTSEMKKRIIETNKKLYKVLPRIITRIPRYGGKR